MSVFDIVILPHGYEMDNQQILVTFPHTNYSKDPFSGSIAVKWGETEGHGELNKHIVASFH